ncbi:MAG: HD domain-containing protein [Firmicutes bacterium]|nr:HD domain-containing protein [Bacillota bacterium]
MEYKNSELIKILDTGIALSKERDRNKLLDKILDESMDITHCDAGTLYMYRENKLHFHLMKTISMNVNKGKDGEVIDLPPVPMVEENICAYTVIHKKPLNIENVYESTEFDFSGPYKYDQMTGYHTVSMLTIPLLNQEGEAVGVLQLINAMDEQENVIAFAHRMEHIILALASQAAIAVSNIRYVEELKEQMWSFTEAMAETIDTRTPYNANHIRMVANYASKLADFINEQHERGVEKEYFSKNRKEQLILAALLHDMGKVAIPENVMNKATRLEHRLKDIEIRFELFRARYQIQMLEGTMTQDEYDTTTDCLDNILKLVREVNVMGFLSDEKKQELEKVFTCKYVGKEGTQPYFTEEEKEDLLIRKGTLTEKEREVMQSHVEMTERILSKVHFNDNYQDVMKWAVQHHECLDGSGYPRHLTGDALSTEARILAVADICDALLATDRPYKKPIPKDKAFAIMRDMVNQGKLDGKIVDYLEQCI